MSIGKYLWLFVCVLWRRYKTPPRLP